MCPNGVVGICSALDIIDKFFDVFRLPFSFDGTVMWYSNVPGSVFVEYRGFLVRCTRVFERRRMCVAKEPV